ncbi:MAG TPA: pilus assembly protein TadG-related protein [Parvularculaceae bacterium]|nr:pilus assembly protein TadG-related protein [Parvularculaceae bacterium]
MRLLNGFASDKRGNISIMFAFMLVLVLLFTGGAIDYTRRNAVRADLIDSLDAAGLAMAQLDESNPAIMQNMTPAEKTNYLKDYGRRFFHENFGYENEIKNFSLDFVVTEQKITPVATGEIKTLFLAAAERLLGNPGGADTLSMSASTEITRRGSGPIELALVLDVTGSMNSYVGSKRKIDSLKEAVDALLDELYGDADNATSEYVKTSVVPFAAYVNSGAAVYDDGSAAWDSAWSDTSAQSSYHGAHFLHVDSTGTIDLTTKVNHFELYNSISGTNWAGCNMELAYPLDEIDVDAGTAASNAVINSYGTAPTGASGSVVTTAFSSAPTPKLSVATLSTAANTLFVPQFAADDPDCDSSNECEWSSSNQSLNGITYKGNWFHNPGNNSYGNYDGYNNSYISDKQYTYKSPSTYLAQYLPIAKKALEVLRYHSGYSGSSSRCPSTGTQDSALNTWLSARGATDCFDAEYNLRQAYVGYYNDSDPSNKRYVGKYDLSSSVSSSRGPNDNCPAAPIFVASEDKEKIQDFVDSLTPGGNTNSAEGMMWGWRVLSPEAPFESEFDYNDGKWQKAVVLMTDGFNTISSADTPWGTELGPYGYGREERMGVGVDTSSEMRDQFDDKLVRICSRMKAKGILVYAVTFGLDDNDPDEKATKDVFRACATEPEEPYYFDAPDGDELKTAFADIASDLVDLHVSK